MDIYKYKYIIYSGVSWKISGFKQVNRLINISPVCFTLVGVSRENGDVKGVRRIRLPFILHLFTFMCVRKADSFCVSANKTWSLDTIYVFIMKRSSLRFLLPFNLFFYTMRLITTSVKIKRIMHS